MKKGKHLKLINLLASGIPLFTGLIIYLKMQVTLDTWKIEHEMGRQTFIVFLGLLLNILLYIFFNATTPSHDMDINHRSEWLAYFIPSLLVPFGLSLFGTAYPLYLSRFSKDFREDRMRERRRKEREKEREETANVSASSLMMASNSSINNRTYSSMSDIHSYRRLKPNNPHLKKALVEVLGKKVG